MNQIEAAEEARISILSCDVGLAQPSYYTRLRLYSKYFNRQWTKDYLRYKVKFAEEYESIEKHEPFTLTIGEIKGFQEWCEKPESPKKPES